MEFVFEGLGAGFAAFYTVYTAIASAFSVAVYVLRALSLHTISKRRGINHPWMSWIPVLDLWVLGCISDQYQYVVKGKNKNKRKWLLGLSIAMAVTYITFFVFCGISVFGAISGATGAIDTEKLITSLMGPVMSMLLCLIPMIAIAISVMVIRYVALYDLYTSCNPQNNVLFLVLGIFFSVAEPFFLLYVRNKDEGMPPRRQQPQYIPPQPEYVPPQDEI